MKKNASSAVPDSAAKTEELYLTAFQQIQNNKNEDALKTIQELNSIIRQTSGNVQKNIGVLDVFLHCVSSLPDFDSKGKAACQTANLLREQGDSAAGEKLLRDMLNDAGCTRDTDVVNQSKRLAGYLFAEDRLNDAIALMRSAEKRLPASAFVKEESAKTIAKMHILNIDRDSAIRVLKEADLQLEAAKLLFPSEAWKDAARILKDETRSVSERVGAYEYLIESLSPDYAELRKQYRAFYRENTKNVSWPTITCGPLWNAMADGDYVKAAELSELSRSYPELKDNYELVFFHIRSLYALGRDDEAGAIAKEYAVCEKFTEQQRLICSLLAELNDPNSAERNLRKFPLSEKLTALDRSKALIQAGKAALSAGKDSAVKKLYDTYLSLFAAEPVKTFEMTYFENPVTGLSDFFALKDRPAPQMMDRKYGGNMDFLVTDVATGERKVSDAKFINFDKIYAFCDENGLHFVIEVPSRNPQAAVQGLENGGSFELYISSGRHQPHTCILANVGSNKTNVYNTTYDTNLHHRMRNNNPDDLYCDVRAGKNSVWQHIFIDWNNFYSCLPENGTEWDFENLHWASFMGGYGWNGTKSIHGHSTWGKLKFHLTSAQENRIRYHAIVRAKTFYEQEKNSISNNYKERQPGAVNMWQDPVIGDTGFFETQVKPLTDKLDSYLPLVKTDMSDSDIRKVYNEAAKDWYNIVHILDERRAAYLQDKLLEE